MSLRQLHSPTRIVLVGTLILVAFTHTLWSQETPSVENKSPAARAVAKPTASPANPMEVFRPDVGNWDAQVQFWLRPGTEPLKSQAVVTSQMTLDGMYFEQRVEGTFGPELGNKKWSSLSFTGYHAASGQYETVRMANSNVPMITVRGEGKVAKEGVFGLEQRGEYEMMGTKATERDVISHPEADKCIIQSWMSFGGSEEFLGVEMILTRTTPQSIKERKEEVKSPPIRLGNFSISLAVKDLQASFAFYEKLGFRQIAGTPKSYLILQNDGSTIGLFQGMLDKNMLTFNPGWDRTCATLADFDDIREIQVRLQEKGTVLRTTADPTKNGPASILLEDPDGNVILIDQHVPRPAK